MLATKSLAKGVIMGVGDVGGDVIMAARETARAAVSSAAEVGGDLAMVARRAVDGVIEATARRPAVTRPRSPRPPPAAPWRPPAPSSNTAVATVRDVLVGIAGGIEDVVGAVLPKTIKPGA